MLPPGFQQTVYPISGKELVSWQDSVASYSSQLSSFWTSDEQMRTALTEHRALYGGIVIVEPGRVINLFHSSSLVIIGLLLNHYKFRYL